ncbi:MAG TPA: hypothetical protein VH107_01850 [Lacipirellulaceae bacterium]|nr:hypothetical protein [Lacipirellulaceae bacterium]
MSSYRCPLANSRLRWGLTILVAAAMLLSPVATARCLAETGTVIRTESKTAPDGFTLADTKDPKLGQDWVRLDQDAAGEVRGMQTAIVRYTPGGLALKDAATQVDLIAAVHIADPAYYAKLNERFKHYDVLLYELVAPEGTVVEKGRGTSNAHPIGAMQNVFKDVLQLDHQLEDVDYTRPNFVHADMSPDDFKKAMEERNDTFLQMYFRLIGQAMAHQSEMAAKGDASDFELFSAMLAPDRPRRLKIVLAKQLSEMESLMVSFGGENGSAIITDRNKKALAVLKKEIADGKKKIGIFYGAGHLSDMDKRLRSDFGLEPVAITWLTAWDLAEKK